MNSSLERFYNPVNLSIGVGALGDVADIISGDEKVLIITSEGFSKRGLVQYLIKLCRSNECIVFDKIKPNPELDDLDDLISYYRSMGVTFIIALGGGSAIDAGKVLATAIPTQIEKPLNMLFREKVDIVFEKKIPLLVIPTTSGTGAEVTPFATVWDSVTNKKFSLSGAHLFASNAILDPELCLTLPYKETLNTALDSISHALESLWNKGRTKISEMYAVESLILSRDSLPKLLKNLDCIESRVKMQRASLYSGFAISQTKTAIAHSISYPITSHFGVPHGLACSFTLPYIIDWYLENVKNERNYQIILEIKELLLSIRLSEKIKNFCSLDEVLNLKGEMYSPERAANFVCDVTDQDLETVLIESLK